MSRKKLSAGFFALVLACSGAYALPLVGAQDEPQSQPVAARLDSNSLARQLTNSDPLKRQHAAEELARLAATEQRRLVEGYRLQEKNERVRVALDWALYRMGKREVLYSLVRALDSSRSDQAQVYLSELEGPDALYVFLPRANGNTQIKLLQILAYLGNAETLERIKPFAASLDPKIAEAARQAERDINERLNAPSNAPARSRQRVTGASDEEKSDDAPPQR
ncbi:MAG TPA: hypothetical protein VGB73_14165 [Pyrinomonadaceae bacterium]|jgi:hypothetical protein